MFNHISVLDWLHFLCPTPSFLSPRLFKNEVLLWEIYSFWVYTSVVIWVPSVPEMSCPFMWRCNACPCFTNSLKTPWQIIILLLLNQLTCPTTPALSLFEITLCYITLRFNLCTGKIILIRAEAKKADCVLKVRVECQNPYLLSAVF